MPKRYELPKVIKVPRFEEDAGFYTTKERSRLMSRIKGKNTTPELSLRKALWEKGVRYRIDFALLPGKPDIVISKYKIVIFVDGEFWHGYKWEEKRKRIKSNRGFWIPKIERNIQRDRNNNERLELMGYTVFRFWESEVKKNLDSCVAVVINHIENISDKVKYQFNP